MIGLLAQVAGEHYFTFERMERLGAGVLASVVYGLIGIVLLLLGYWLFDRITPHIDVEKELSEKNLAVAIVVGALLLGIAYIVAQVVSA
jgi:putative membrane protein